MKNLVMFILVLGTGFVFAAPGFAIDFQFEKDHCAAGEYQSTNPQSGGQKAGFMGLHDTGWGETGQCVKLPIEQFASAVANLNVMVWKGVTSIVSVDDITPLGSSELYHTKIMYEARANQFGCHTAQWPMEWNATVTAGTTLAPSRILVHSERVPGGNSDGAYVKSTSVLVEILKASASQISLHMRYEIEAPGELGPDALGAIGDYTTDLLAVAGGGQAPGPIENPECPNPTHLW